MRIGLTYDLRSAYLAEGYTEEETAEFDRDDTIDAIESALHLSGWETDRVGHVRNLVQRLACGDRWELVFNICEGLRGSARESQVPALLDAYKIPYTFSDPMAIGISLDKGLTKLVLGRCGIPTPRFAVVRELTDCQRLELNYPLFAKPNAEGTGKGVTSDSRIEQPDQLLPVCRELLRRFQQPVLVEEFLPGREFTIGVWGTGSRAEVIGTLEIVLRKEAESGVYSYLNKEYCESLVDYRFRRGIDDEVVEQAEQIALAAYRELHCRDAGRVDIRCDGNGRPQFIEINPLAGLHPEHSDLPMVCTAAGYSYSDLIQRIVRSAAARCHAERTRPRSTTPFAHTEAAECW